MKDLAQHYQILGLPLTASPEEIKQTYRNLAKLWHPDRFLNDPVLQEKAESEIKKINQAYAAIRDNQTQDNSFHPVRTVSSHKNTPEFHYLRGMALAEAENFSEAITEFSLAIRLNPNYLEAYQYRGFILSKLGYEHRAKSDLQKATQLKLTNQINNYGFSQPPSVQKEIKNNALLHTIIAHNKPVSCVAISRDGKFLASGSQDKSIQLWQLNTVQAIGTLNGHKNSINCLFWLDNHRTLISGSEDKTIKFWDLAFRKNVYTFGSKFSGHTQGVNALSIDSEHNHLISMGNDCTIKTWDLKQGRAINSVNFPEQTFTCLALTKDNQFFCSGSLEKQLRIRSIQSGQVVRSIRGDSGVLSLAFSPDGNLLATGGFDCKITLWDITTGQKIYNLTGHLDRVCSLVFSIDGRFLASGSWDKTIKLWKLNNGQEIRTFTGHSDKVSCIAIAPNNQSIISGSADCTIKIWQAMS